MITNDRQYKTTREKAADFARVIEEFNANSHERTVVHPKLLRAELKAMESQLAALRDEIDQYEQLKSGDL
ncbi:MAG: hypothetical protein F4053_01490 [Proteobacteria bacterium]|nr:hypothetical protein [Pseudomonadota bacterium]